MSALENACPLCSRIDVRFGVRVPVRFATIIAVRFDENTQLATRWSVLAFQRRFADFLWGARQYGSKLAQAEHLPTDSDDAADRSAVSAIWLQT